MNKQMREGIILAVALVALIGVAIYTFRGQGGASSTSGGTKSPVTSTTATAPTSVSTKGSTAESASEKIDWVNPGTVGTLVVAAKAGRDPFVDLTLPVKVARATQPPTGGQPRGGARPLPLPNPAPVPAPLPMQEEKEYERTMRLTWASPLKIMNAIEDEGLNVLFKSTNASEVFIKGPKPDFDEAVAIVKKLDMAPPVPAFQLAGIVSTGRSRFATINLDGRFYTLIEHESVPGTGWSVTKITPTGVTLTKGKQSVSLRLSGGSPS